MERCRDRLEADRQLRLALAGGAVVPDVQLRQTTEVCLGETYRQVAQRTLKSGKVKSADDVRKQGSIIVEDDEEAMDTFEDDLERRLLGGQDTSASNSYLSSTEDNASAALT